MLILPQAEKKLPACENNYLDFIAFHVIGQLKHYHNRKEFIIYLNLKFLIFFNFSPLPSLPNERGMRPIQSPRPFTTYELDQIRQFQRQLVSSIIINFYKSIHVFIKKEI